MIFGGDLVAFGGEVFQHFGAGGVAGLGLFAGREFEFVEQDFLELFGGADGERFAVREGEDGGFEGLDLSGEGCG